MGVKKDEGFQDAYGRWNPRYQNYSFDDTGKEAARDYGKAAALGETAYVGDLRDRQVITRVGQLRGYSQADLDKITGPVERAFGR